MKALQPDFTQTPQETGHDTAPASLHWQPPSAAKAYGAGPESAAARPGAWHEAVFAASVTWVRNIATSSSHLHGGPTHASGRVSRTCGGPRARSRSCLNISLLFAYCLLMTLFKQRILPGSWFLMRRRVLCSDLKIFVATVLGIMHDVAGRVGDSLRQLS